ncbi:MAG: hypothetical protein LiPW15_449 [Parcubacteria group bacterium LiPW_15]|nr:MAG: hypothetical protein LiPW15_449 [Parcubacteria group bacterium LiPW_15]
MERETAEICYNEFMKKIYLSLGLALFLVVAFSASMGFAVMEPENRDTGYCFSNPGASSCGVITYDPPRGGGGGGASAASSTPLASGVLSFVPSSVKDKGVFTISLSGAADVPANTVARLWIDPDNSGSFKNFGTWLTVGELKKGVQRTMNCSAYSSYEPGRTVDVRGKILNQRLFISYEGLGYGSEIISHTKDCSVASGGGGATPPVPAAPTGPATCSVTPGSATINQDGTLDFTVNSNQAIGGNYVYVVARDFSSGIFSDVGVGKVISPGANSVGFKLYALSNAMTGNKTFKVVCSTGCPVSGCPSGGSAEIIGSATVNLIVTGTNPSGGGGTGGGSGGGTGSASCSVPNVSIPANSSLYLSVEASVGSVGDVYLAGSTGQNISLTPVHPNIKFEAGFQRGREPLAAIVRTGPNFSGGDSYSLTCDLPAGKTTAMGVASLPVVANPLGKMKLSQVEYLGDTMFPNSECSYDVKGCQEQFYDGKSGPRIVNYNGSPVLVGGVEKAMYPAPAKGTITTPRMFSLADPMNPVAMTSLDGPSIRPSEDAFGDFGAALSAGSVAWSQDGKYRAIVSSQGWLFVSINGGRKIRVTSNVTEPASIVKSGSEYILVHGRGAINITNPSDFENYEEETHEPLPSNFPELGEGFGNNYGSKIVSDDGLYLVVLPTDSINRLIPNFSPKIKLFSVSQKEPLAELQVPDESLALGHYSVRVSGKISFAGGDYIFAVRNVSNAVNSKRAVDVFKVEYAAKKITQIVKSALLPEGTVAAAAGFDLGSGNVGVITFNAFDTGGTTNPYGNYEEKIKAFLFSDLAAGKTVDILTNSPVSVSAETGSVATGGGALGRGGTVGPVEAKADSFSRNGVTYVYTSNSFGINVKVWKFEAASGGSTGGGTPPTIPPGGTPNTGVGCDFTLTPVPATLTVARGSSFAVYGLKASDNTDKTCSVSVTAQALKDSSGNRIISPSSAASTVIVPGTQNIFYFNLSNPPSGSYDIPIKAYARGVATKTLSLKLIVQ